MGPPRVGLLACERVLHCGVKGRVRILPTLFTVKTLTLDQKSSGFSGDASARSCCCSQLRSPAICCTALLPIAKICRAIRIASANASAH